MDVDDLVATDVHNHVHRSVHGATYRAEAEDMGEHAGIGAMRQYSLPGLAGYCRERNMAAVLFGSGVPVITPERWMEDFAALAIEDDVRPLIMKENAARLFGLRPEEHTA